MDFKFIISIFSGMGEAVRNTILIVFVSAAIGWVLGLLIAIARQKKIKGLSQILAVFVSFIRSVPLIIIIFFIIYAIPTMISYYKMEHGIPVKVTDSVSIWYPIAAISLSEATFASEAFRSALNSIPIGQLEAARSVGMTNMNAYFRIILPQALVVALPNMSGLLIGLVKSSTLAYYSSVAEVTGTAYAIASRTYQFLEAFFVIAIIYELFSFIISRVFLLLEKHLGKYRRGIVIE